MQLESKNESRDPEIKLYYLKFKENIYNQIKGIFCDLHGTPNSFII